MGGSWRQEVNVCVKWGNLRETSQRGTPCFTRYCNKFLYR